MYGDCIVSDPLTLARGRWSADRIAGFVLMSHARYRHVFETDEYRAAIDGLSDDVS